MGCFPKLMPFWDPASDQPGAITLAPEYRTVVWCQLGFPMSHTSLSAGDSRICHASSNPPGPASNPHPPHPASGPRMSTIRMEMGASADNSSAVLYRVL